MKSFALYEMDYKLREYLPKKGFFIECGANNGITQSNTYFFELYQDWTGLLVEASPERAKICKENRPDCIVENYALVSKGYDKRGVMLVNCKDKQGMMSLLVAAKVGDEMESHLQRSGSEKEIIEVPAITLTELLDKHKIKHIDFFSLDVEGYEAEVLKGLDFDRYKPTFILVEQNDNKVAPILEPLYDMIEKLTHHDYLYKLK